MPDTPTGHPELLSLQTVVALALAEDLGAEPQVAGDVTAAATVPAATRATASFVPRGAGVLAGLQVISETYRQLDPSVVVRLLAADGDDAVPGRPLAEVSGPARAVLAGERTALNLLTHLSGIATTTRAYVAAAAPHPCAVRDTRKTLPGLRGLQKAAVLAGGGVNHRMSLLDGLLVKDNHVAAAGGMAAAAAAALAGAGGLEVQIEVDSLAQLDVALQAGADSVLLDNFTPEEAAEGVSRCRATGRAVFVEASGGITLETIARYAAAGVDAVAVGALTHSSTALDIGLDIDLDTPHRSTSSASSSGGIA